MALTVSLGVVLAAAGCETRPTGASQTIEVRIETTGAAFDADGYTLVVNGEPRFLSIPPNATHTISRGARSVTLELTDVADHCAVAGEARVAPGAAGMVTFQVHCTAPDGLAGARLLFVRRSGRGHDLHWLSLDGSPSVPVTTDGLSRDPAVSATGQIAFARGGGPGGTWAIHSMTMDGSTTYPLTTGGAYSQPSWSPDGARFVHVVSTEAWMGSLEVRTVGSEEVVPLSQSPAFSDQSPAWSPDGTRVAFDRFASELAPTGIFVTTLDGKQLIEVAPSGRFPVWSIGSDLIAFRQSEYLVIVPADGTGAPVFMLHIGAGHGPTAWSADGRWLLFTLDLYDPDVYAADVTTRQLYRLTADGRSHSAVFATQP